MTSRQLLASVVATAACFVFAGTAHSDAPGRVTFGDVNSLFNSFAPGFNLVSGDHPANPSVSVAAPADGVTRGRLSPLPVGPKGPYCENDWVVVNVFAFYFKSNISRKEAAEDIAGFDADYTLDGEPVESLSTPLRGAMRGPKSNKDRVWFVSDGFFIEPGSLAPGFHMVQLTLTLDGAPVISPAAAFEILAASHPDCS
jgi:hypothetical protein